MLIGILFSPFYQPAGDVDDDWLSIVLALD